jgi:predicted metal-dependent hydrolase
MTMEHDIVEGIHLFNTRKCFEAHEELEAVWLKAKGHRKTFLHGLIQVAAAFHHYAHRNPAGFRSLLEKGCTKLEIRGRGRGPGPGRLDDRTSALAGTS